MGIVTHSVEARSFINKLGVQQYTSVAFIRGEHSNCSSEVGCLPEEDNPARVNNLDFHLV